MRHGEIILDWADGKHKFRLAIGEWRELQGKVGIGPLALFKRITRGDWMIDDLYEVIRIGLIGGGLDPIKAMILCNRYIGELEIAPLMHVSVAAKIVEAGLSTPKGEKSLKKGIAARMENKTIPSPLPQSSAAEP